ncbi:hypothetical protein [Microbacterium thalli]|nr:hypothetical protein [Microbacterium thalli]MDD7930049.1 hypothetical protein [Microbacterium thalli]
MEWFFFVVLGAALFFGVLFFVVKAAIVIGLREHRAELRTERRTDDVPPA